MNANNRLEECLSAWIPRRPSARVERRLFGKAPGARAEASPGLMPSLAPALLLVLLAVAGALEGPGPFGRVEEGMEGVSEMQSPSNRLLAAVTGPLNRHNGFPRSRFEWTSPGSIPSSNRSPIQMGTNSLRR